jgi:hypothetical protein
MSEGNLSDFVTAAGTVVAAGAAVYAAYLAKQASDTWLKGLEYQRIDEAIRAVLELRSKIDRVVSLREADPKNVWDAYTDAWTSWRRFEQAYAVARRYRQSLSNNPIQNTFAQYLTDLRDLCRKSYDKAAFDTLKYKVGQLAKNTADALSGTTAPAAAAAQQPDAQAEAQ